MFGRPGMPAASSRLCKLDCRRDTINKLYLAHELAHRNWTERSTAQAIANTKLLCPLFNVGNRVLVHRPYTESKCSHHNVTSPSQGLYTARAHLSPVTQ